MCYRRLDIDRGITEFVSERDFHQGRNVGFDPLVPLLGKDLALQAARTSANSGPSDKFEDHDTLIATRCIEKTLNCCTAIAILIRCSISRPALGELSGRLLDGGPWAVGLFLRS